MKYKHNDRKSAGKYHIVNDDTGKTFCKVENGSSRITSTCSQAPEGKVLCKICSGMSCVIKPEKSTKTTRKTKNQTKKEFYSSNEWARIRYDVLKDAEFCLCCGATKKETRLTVDHIKPLGKYPELRYDRDNMQVLCRLCNRGKGGDDETDFRPVESKEKADDIDAKLDSTHLADLIHRGLAQ